MSRAVAYAESLSISQRDYVLAARSCGAPGARIMLRHVLPNAFAPLIVIGTFQVAQAVISESSLSFLGLGVPSAPAVVGSRSANPTSAAR